MNSSSCSCQWRSAEAEPALMRVILTPNWVKATASPILCFSRPEITAANSFGYDTICCAGIFSISILGICSPVQPLLMIAIHLFISWFSEEKLDPLDDRGRTHASADAQRHQCGRETASLQFINDGAEDHGARRAERVTHGDRPTIDIDLGRIEVESLAIAQHYGRKCLVDFDEIDVVERHLRLRQNLLRHVNGPGQHDCGLRADIGERLDAHTRLQPSFLARLLAADQHGSGAVDDAGRIAGMVHMIDRLELGMRLYRDRIKATHLAELHEGRIELRQGLHGGSGAHVLILGEDGEPVHVLDRNNRARETAFVPRSRRALLALHGIGVDVVAGETVFSRDEVGRNPLRHEIGFERDGGIHGPGAACGADADPDPAIALKSYFMPQGISADLIATKY